MRFYNSYFTLRTAKHELFAGGFLNSRPGDEQATRQTIIASYPDMSKRAFSLKQIRVNERCKALAGCRRKALTKRFRDARHCVSTGAYITFR